MDREKELNKMIYEKSKLISMYKKEIKIHRAEIEEINQEKTKRRKLEKRRK